MSHHCLADVRMLVVSWIVTIVQHYVVAQCLHCFQFLMSLVGKSSALLVLDVIFDGVGRKRQMKALVFADENKGLRVLHDDIAINHPAGGSSDGVG